MGFRAWGAESGRTICGHWDLEIYGLRFDRVGMQDVWLGALGATVWGFTV